MKYIFFFVVALMINVSAASAQNLVKEQVCLIENGELKTIMGDYDPASGNHTIVVKGTRKDLYSVYPQTGPGYASGQAWYINSEPVPFNKKSYIKYGLPRILSTSDVVKSGIYKGVGVYVEAGHTGPVEVIYLPARQGCEFQPYQVDCGRAKIEKVKATKTTMELRATVTGVTGKNTYSWSAGYSKILKGQGTPKITIDVSNRKAKETIYVELKVNQESGCPINSNERFEVEK